MNDDLLSILCDEEDYWRFHPYTFECIKFNKDGTGELWCMHDHVFTFAVNMDWNFFPPPKPKPEEAVETSLGIASWWSNKPQVLGRLGLQITLNTTYAKSATRPMAISNERYLSEVAFKPRKFTVTIEKGNFRHKSSVGKEGKFRHRFGLRLLFDKSPYPLPEGFKNLDEGPIPGYGFEEMDMFIGKSLPESETKGKAVNDDSAGGWTMGSFFR